MKCQVVDAIQWGGGGVVAEFFRGLPGSTRFSGGGSSRVFPWSPYSRRDARDSFFRALHKPDATRFISGGGVVPAIFR